jgi:hypothetical protein
MRPSTLCQLQNYIVFDEFIGDAEQAANKKPLRKVFDPDSTCTNATRLFLPERRVRPSRHAGHDTVSAIGRWQRSTCYHEFKVVDTPCHHTKARTSSTLSTRARAATATGIQSRSRSISVHDVSRNLTVSERQRQRLKSSSRSAVVANPRSCCPTACSIEGCDDAGIQRSGPCLYRNSRTRTCRLWISPHRPVKCVSLYSTPPRR